MLNKVFLVGRIGKDPDIKYGEDGSVYGRVSMATSERWNDRNGERQEKTTWHDVLVQSKTAEFVEKNVVKGQLVHVEGSIDIKVVENDQGEKRYYHRVKAHRFLILDWGDKKPGNQHQDGPEDPPDSPVRRAPPKAAGRTR